MRIAAPSERLVSLMTSSAVFPVKDSPSASYAAQMASFPPLSQYGDLLTVDNMAEVLDVSTRTIYRLAETDELPSVKVGRRLYFPKRRLIEALRLGGAM